MERFLREADSLSAICVEQYVILTDGDERIRYFKHSAYETSKDCPERTFGSSASFEYQAQEYELPLRLASDENDRFGLELWLACMFHRINFAGRNHSRSAYSRVAMYLSLSSTP